MCAKRRTGIHKPTRKGEGVKQQWGIQKRKAHASELGLEGLRFSRDDGDIKTHMGKPQQERTDSEITETQSVQARGTGYRIHPAFQYHCFHESYHHPV